MAAVVRPHHLPTTVPRRPDLRVLPGGRTATAELPPLRVTPAAVVALLVALVVVVGAVLALGRGTFAGLAPDAAPAAATAPAAGAATVTVHSGDTLWAIARRLQPTGDVRALVDELVEANGSAVVVPGQRLVIPS